MFLAWHTFVLLKFVHNEGDNEISISSSVSNAKESVGDAETKFPVLSLGVNWSFKNKRLSKYFQEDDSPTPPASPERCLGRFCNSHLNLSLKFFHFDRTSFPKTKNWRASYMLYKKDK